MELFENLHSGTPNFSGANQGWEVAEDMEADKCTFFGLRQRRTSTSDSIGPPTASDFISDSVGLLSPTASDYNLRQRRTTNIVTISDSVGLQSPTAS